MASMSQKRVLLVEDDKTMNMLLGKQLEKFGFAVTKGFSGREALEAMSKEVFDAILLDLILPEVDGFEVMQKKGETKCAGVPFYVLTNLGSEDSLTRARALGAKEVWVKTMVSPKDVIGKMKQDLAA